VNGDEVDNWGFVLSGSWRPKAEVQISVQQSLGAMVNTSGEQANHAARDSPSISLTSGRCLQQLP
jgi:hypothetical protein